MSLLALTDRNSRNSHKLLITTPNRLMGLYLSSFTVASLLKLIKLFCLCCAFAFSFGCLCLQCMSVFAIFSLLEIYLCFPLITRCRTCCKQAQLVTHHQRSIVWRCWRRGLRTDTFIRAVQLFLHQSFSF